MAKDFRKSESDIKQIFFLVRSLLDGGTMKLVAKNFDKGMQG